MSSRILIVEDEMRIAQFLLRGLAEEGYAVEHASDGREAWLLLSTQAFDLVLLDWWLPGEDGLQLLKRFRSRNRHTPVLFVTARDGVEQRVDGLDAGADDYLCKPFAYDELLARVRALLRRPGRSLGTTLRYRDVTVDLAAQRAERAGQPLDLTAKELSLLICFLRHPGEVLTRTRIYDSVWGERYDGLSNTLEVHLKELRRKLEAFGPRLVQTRRGQGYILEGPESDSDAEGAAFA